MKKILLLATVGLFLSAGSSYAQDRHRNHQGHSRPAPHHHSPPPRHHHYTPPHHHHHRTPGWVAPAIIGGGLALGYGLYQYNQPPPAYYEPPIYSYPEVKVWDSYCGCYRIVPN